MQTLDRRGLMVRGIAALGGLGAAKAATAGDGRGLPLTAQTTEGPYFLPGQPLRNDITEGLPGVPLDICIVVQDQRGEPLAGCRVDVWHCDARGLYAGFPGQGDDGATDTTGASFLRGALLADAGGAVVFRSIYPGWYAGRTTHIHFKVAVGPRIVLTSQFFLPDALSEYLYTALPTYRRTTLRGVLNSTDGIALRAGDTVIGAVREAAGRYVAQLTVVVDALASPPVHRPGPGSGPPPGARGGGGPPPGFGGVPALPVPQGQARVQALVPGGPAR